MTHVVSESCIRCKYTDCVDVCPVDCFREGPNMLVIDPDECIDCAVCIPECPVNAIYAEEDLPADQMDFIKLNVELSQQPATQLEANAIGVVELVLQAPIAALPFAQSRILGSLVLVDTASHKTSGAALILSAQEG